MFARVLSPERENGYQSKIHSKRQTDREEEEEEEEEEEALLHRRIVFTWTPSVRCFLL